MLNVTRRSFLLGGAGALALAACGGGSKSASKADRTTSTSTTAGGLAIAKVFSPTQAAGRAIRLPLALADSQGALLDKVPTSITVHYGVDGGATMSDAVDLHRHAQGIPTPYFPLVATFPTTGTWRIEIEADGVQADTTLNLVPAEQVPAVPVIGDRMISMATPTNAAPGGVEPICTRDPMCPFHEQSLDHALASRKPTIFLISTPAYCQSAICGPVLDLLIDRKEQLGDSVSIVHAEVYTDSTAKTTTDAVQTYGLEWEPALFMALPDGTIVSRLDYTFDGVELDGELARLVP